MARQTSIQFFRELEELVAKYQARLIASEVVGILELMKHNVARDAIEQALEGTGESEDWKREL